MQLSSESALQTFDTSKYIPVRHQPRNLERRLAAMVAAAPRKARDFIGSLHKSMSCDDQPAKKSGDSDHRHHVIHCTIVFMQPALFL